MSNETLFLASEVKELESLLASIPAENLLERISLEARLANTKEALASLPQRTTKKAQLTFRGKPVFGSHGIAADFGAKAAGAFSDVFAAVAASLSEGLNDMGPIPDRGKNQLLITGTAIGSFGFEFELPSAELALFPETTKAEEAMEKIESLFRLSALGTDDEMAEIIDEVHPRAVKKAHEFFELLVQQQAWCALQFEDRAFCFSDYEQIRASNERLKGDNIQERQETYSGEFQGVLPASRTFEFKLSDQSGILKGKVDKAIADPDVLNREWLYKPVKIVLNVMQVGQGRPRYTLTQLDNLRA